MGNKRYELTEEQWSKIKDLIPQSKMGRPRKDDRLTGRGVFIWEAMMKINDTLRFQNIGLPEDILRMKNHGDYENAVRLIDIRLQDENLPRSLYHCLQVQREMMVRMAVEFPYSYDEALAIIRQSIPDFTKEEFDRIIAQRKVRWSYVNGEFRIFNRFFTSLIKAYPGFAQRAGICGACSSRQKS